MMFRRLGRHGPRISVLGLGFWQAGSTLWGCRDESVYHWVRESIRIGVENGINFYDTAEIYGWGFSEKALGRALREIGVGDEVVVASKVAGFRWTKDSILKAVRNTNRRLGRTVDLIQHHWPPPVYAPLCSIVRGLEEAVKQGLAHYYGFSNYDTRLLEKALECTRRIEPVSNQIQYSLGYRVAEKKLKPYMEKHGLTLIAWGPLAKGSLAGLSKAKTLAQKTDPVFRAVSRDKKLQETITRIALKYNVPRSAVALAWLIAKNATPIPGLRKPYRVKEYLQAVNIKLDTQDIQLLDKASEKYMDKWGKEYGSLKKNRLIPGTLQYIFIKLIRGA